MSRSKLLQAVSHSSDDVSPLFLLRILRFGAALGGTGHRSATESATPDRTGNRSATDSETLARHWALSATVVQDTGH